jgi:type III secretion protein W
MSTAGRTDTNIPTPVGTGSLWSSASTAATARSAGGQAAQALDAPSSLADAAEEISMLFSEKVETLTHKQREVESGSHVLVMDVEEINAYLEAAKAFQDPARLAELAKRMLAAGNSPRQLAEQQSGDRTNQYVLLQHAFKQGQQQGASAESLDRLADAIAEMEDRFGPQIRAGLNSINSASLWANDAAGVATFQRTYRDVALGDLPLAQALRLVLERLGGSSGELIEQGLKAMISALGADLAAVRPSRERVRLKTLRSDLYDLTVINTVFEGCKTLERRLQAPNVNPRSR